MQQVTPPPTTAPAHTTITTTSTATATGGGAVDVAVEDLGAAPPDLASDAKELRDDRDDESRKLAPVAPPFATADAASTAHPMARLAAAEARARVSPESKVEVGMAPERCAAPIASSDGAVGGGGGGGGGGMGGGARGGRSPWCEMVHGIV